jgi:hypothetical protein
VCFSDVDCQLTAVQALLNAQGVPIGWIENLAVQTMAVLGNYLPMRVGTILRFQYFKTVHGIAYTSFAGMMSMRALFLIFVTSLLGSLTLLTWYRPQDYAGYVVISLFLSMFAAPLLLYLFKPDVSIENKVLAKFARLFLRAKLRCNPPINNRYQK